MKPTQEQIKKFWKGCEVRELLYGNPEVAIKRFKMPDGEILADYPPIDLNNLFKYAVPKLIEKVGKEKAFQLLVGWLERVISYGEDPAFALFWAIYKVIDER